MNRFKQYTTIAFLLLATIGYSQNDNSDFATWSTLAVEYQLNKKWGFELEEQLRLKNNSSEIDEYFTQLNVGYKISKKFKLGVGLRYVSENDNKGKIQGYDNLFRFNIDATYKQKVNDFSLFYRLRYQNKNEIGVSNEEGDYANQNIRLKAGVGYNISNWSLDPSFSAEIFNHFEKEDENGFSKYRLTLGTDYNIKKIGKLGLFYRYQGELNSEDPDTTHIVGLKFIYTIKNKKQKDKKNDKNKV